MRGHRAGRLAEELREQIADIVGSKLSDPRIGFVTITRVELVPDGSFARVFFGVLGDEAARERTKQGLAKAEGFVRREVARRIRLRQPPEIRFEYDKGLDAADRVGRLLGEIAASPRSADEPPEAAPERGPSDDDPSS